MQSVVGAWLMFVFQDPATQQLAASCSKQSSALSLLLMLFLRHTSAVADTVMHTNKGTHDQHCQVQSRFIDTTINPLVSAAALQHPSTAVSTMYKL